MLENLPIHSNCTDSEYVYFCIWVWCALCSKGQRLLFHIHMWLLECMWMYCTWNWDSFQKCHEHFITMLLSIFWSIIDSLMFLILRMFMSFCYINFLSTIWSFAVSNVTVCSAGIWTNWYSRHTFFFICMADNYVVIHVHTLLWHWML